MVRQYTRLARKIEVMARGSKEVRGAAIGYIETTFKTFYKDGKVHKEKSTKSTMDKIEIYGFDSLDELKAVLAHEIAHLLGVGHVNAKGALMNPTLQKNQIQKLKLTPADIKAFRTIQKKR
jgi:predicted Zn-dependent protease